MATPADGKELLDLIRKSDVADAKRLDAFLQQHQGPLPGDAARMAELLVKAELLTPFQAEQLLQGKWKRFSIGKYRVLDQIGAGGMAQVFLCEHKLMRRRVAVKVLPMGKATDPSALERFYREARAVAALDHPNIVHAYDIDQEDGLHFLVMEYVEGQNLQEMVQEHGKMDVGHACYYIRQAALGLDHANQRGLVHRDIKPGNLLIDRKGQVKILDMGLARFFHDETSVLTNKIEDNRIIGTVDYLSPEQAEDSHDVDTRADIYSLGATFYFVLTGKTIFTDGTVTQKLMWHCQKQPRPIPEMRSDVPPALWAVISKMLAKKPQQRYQTPGEVAEALTPFVPAALLAHSLSSNDTPIPPAMAAAMASAQAINAARSGSTSAPAATASPANPWESLAPSVTDTPLPKSRRHPELIAGIDKNKFWLIVMGVSIFLLTILIVLLFRYAFSSRSPARSGRPLLKVSQKADGASGYRTIQQALRDAKAGDMIELQDNIHKENLIIDPSKDVTTDVTLRAVPGKTVVWTSAQNNEDARLISLYKARSFRLKGEGIILDGTLDNNQRLKDLVLLSGSSPGLTLEDAKLESFARSAITIMNCQGDSDDPVHLLNLTIAAPPSDRVRAGIFFDALPKMLPVNSDFIDIARSCTFMGLDPEHCVRRKDAKAVGENINWQFK